MENTFKYRVAQVMAGEYPERYNVPVCDTPELIQQVGFSGKKIVMEQKKLRRCLAPEETAPSGVRHHDLPIDFVDNLPHHINNPAMILSSLTHSNDSIVLVTDCKDKKDRPIIIALRDEGKRGIVDGEVVTYDKLASVYGREDFADFLERSIKANGSNNGLLYYNEKKSRDLAVSAGLDLPRVLANHDPNVIIRRYNDNVNPLSQNILDFSPDGYGNTLKRSDGKPFAYADDDGRQKTFEYAKTLKGDVVLRSTAATFSDGRSEITEYNESGTITSIERKDAQGRTTYKYWSNGLTFYKENHEESREYYDGKNRYWDDIAERYEPLYKSVHEKERKKEDSRDRGKESWKESDEHGNTRRIKRNEYGLGNEVVLSAHDDSYTHDEYGNVLSHSDKRGYVYVAEYYSPDEVSSYYHFTPDDYDAGVRDYNKRKSEVHKQPDGRVSKTTYEISGEHTEVEYSASGKITRFRDVNGRSYNGQAAQLEYFKSMGGKAPTFKEVAAATNALQSSATPKNKNAGKPNGKPTGSGGNRGSGSSGAGR
ncbi:MAG: hypothetical protein K2F90_00285 [Clostridiales bacterium]|nr:hypothetical protein [Clostridiales bacterium]